MKEVLIIGGGGQVADGLGLFLKTQNVNVYYYRIKQVQITGIPNRPNKTINRLYEFDVIGNLSSFDNCKIKYSWVSKSEISKFKYILFAVPSYLISHYANNLLNELSDKVLINISDRFLGLIELYSIFKKESKRPPKCIISLNSPPLLAYQRGRETPTSIYYFKPIAYYSYYPGNQYKYIDESLNYVFSGLQINFKKCDNMLELAFENINSIIHFVQDLYNLINNKYSLLYSRAHIYDEVHYNKNIIDIINKVTEERDKVALFYCDKIFRNLQQMDSSTFYLKNAFLGGTSEYRQSHLILKNVPTPLIYNAHGYEDVGWSLVPIEKLAQIANIPVPTISNLINQWSCLMKCDYRTAGRNVSEFLNIVIELMSSYRKDLVVDYKRQRIL